MRLVVMGPPGAGKGTQAKVVAGDLGIPHISTGDIFRANLVAGTSLGIAASLFMDRGEYVPDRITNAMVRNRLAEPDATGGFLLDGYPRTLDQVGELDDMLADCGFTLDRVLELTVNVEEVVARLLKRAAEQGRADDTEDVIRHRLEVYGVQTEPLTRVYAERGLLLQVDGMGDVDEVRERILASLRG